MDDKTADRAARVLMMLFAASLAANVYQWAKMVDAVELLRQRREQIEALEDMVAYEAAIVGKRVVVWPKRTVDKL